MLLLWLPPVAVTVPASASAGEPPYRYVATVNENRLTLVEHTNASATAPCL